VLPQGRPAPNWRNTDQLPCRAVKPRRSATSVTRTGSKCFIHLGPWLLWCRALVWPSSRRSVCPGYSVRFSAVRSLSALAQAQAILPGIYYIVHRARYPRTAACPTFISPQELPILALWPPTLPRARRGGTIRSRQIGRRGGTRAVARQSAGMEAPVLLAGGERKAIMRPVAAPRTAPRAAIKHITPHRILVLASEKTRCFSPPNPRCRPTPLSTVPQLVNPSTLEFRHCARSEANSVFNRPGKISPFCRNSYGQPFSW